MNIEELLAELSKYDEMEAPDGMNIVEECDCGECEDCKKKEAEKEEAEKEEK